MQGDALLCCHCFVINDEETQQFHNRVDPLGRRDQFQAVSLENLYFRKGHHMTLERNGIHTPDSDFQS